MGRTHTKSDHDHTARVPGEESRQPFTLAWRAFVIAAVPVALSVYYLSWLAPALVPVPQGLDVPFPGVIPHLEELCSWCGEHRSAVVLIGIGLLAPGILYRLVARRERYYLRLAFICSLALGFTYLHISAPVDRLDKAVDEAIPVDQRVPQHGADGDPQAE